MHTHRIHSLTAGAAALALGLIVAGCQPARPMTKADYVARAKAAVTEISPEQAHKALREHPDIFLMDVSLWVEYRKAHLAGAALVPRGLLEFKIDNNDLFPPVNRGRAPRKDQPILVYCKLGSRSLLAARTLKEMGYRDVRSIAGGLQAWVAAGLPVEKDTGAAASP
ncbi:MAG TPA: rhodanese-like domain-containing protein [Phycisphaerae bacterium]|nr:rhodanese-like domain-containing protein [Phycisphaerae bacterium]